MKGSVKDRRTEHPAAGLHTELQGRLAPRLTGWIATFASSSERTRPVITASPSMAPQLNRSMEIRSSSGQV